MSLLSKSTATLIRWLGPWASPEHVPDVRRERVAIDAYVYEPHGRATGVYVVVPGLHYAGPDDPRMDRFCRVLSAAGLIVVAPFVRCYRTLEVRADASTDVTSACAYAIDLASARGLPRPALFSISFASAPAIEAAASDALRDKLGALVIFGGFHDFAGVIRFAISGRAFDAGRALRVPHDPLNAPAVFINVLPHLEVSDEARDRLPEAWLEMARSTWGRPELRPPVKRQPIADRIASELPPSLRPLFMTGCGLRTGGPALVEAGLSRAASHFHFTDASPHLPRLRAPVVIAHGRDDDVIPFPEALKLARALPTGHRHAVHLTGLYGHTGSLLPPPRALLHEAQTMWSLTRSLVAAAHEAL
ncbi:MAG TPA: hypothetical protein VFB62_27465 [Polyangiaceae bacterium]|nr:hypothetical protein [Polyangiaceae bacterium]